MEWLSKLDPTVLGIILGSFFTVIATFLGQILLLWRDGSRWKRRRRALVDDRVYKLKLREEQRVNDVFKSCLTTLSLLVAEEQNQPPSDDALQRLKTDCISSLVQLELMFCRVDEQATQTIRGNIHNLTLDINDSFSARSQIAEIAQRVASSVNFDKKQAASNTTMNQIRFEVADDYLRKCLVEWGETLERKHVLGYWFKELTESQRSLLWDYVFPNNGSFCYEKKIPDCISLSIPHWNIPDKRIDYTKFVWQASLHPARSNIRDIFVAWERDFTAAHDEAQRHKQHSNKQGA